MARRDDLIEPLFDFAMRELRERVAAGRFINRHHLTDPFAAAVLAERDAELAELNGIAEALPPYDPLGGAIHNFEPGAAPRLVRYRPPTRAAIDQAHPSYHRAWLLETAPNEVTSVRLMLAGDVEQALAAARTDYEQELAIAARALLGDLAGAEASLANLPQNREFGPAMAVLTEAFQLGNEPALLRMVAQVPDRFGSRACVMAIASLCGRLPWVGYPFPDY